MSGDDPVAELSPSAVASARAGSRAVTSNSGFQLVTFAARAVSGLGAAVLLGRAGGPHELGVFQFALTFSLLCSFAVGLGLPNLVAREVARRPDESQRWLEATLMICLVAGAVVAALLGVGAGLVGSSGSTASAVALAGVGLGFDAAARAEFAVFWGWEHMGLETVATCLQEAAFLIATVVLLALGHGAVAVMGAYAGSRALGALAGWVIASRRLHRVVVPRSDVVFVRHTVRRALPFAADDALSLTYIRIDAVLLGFVKGPTAVGLYQAGTNLVLYLNVLARVVNNSLYPRMSRAWPSRPATLGRLRDVSLRVLGAVGVPIATMSLLLAPRIFRLLYGARFDRGVLTYQVLVLVIPIRMLGHTLGTALTAANGQARRTAAVAAAAAANLLLNLYFIPRWSYLGAAITTGLTETSLFVAYAILLRRVAGPSRLVESLAVPSLACVPLAAAMLVTRDAALAITIAAGGVVYGVTMLLVAITRVPVGERKSPRALADAYVRAAA
jgi:O-antigen/teichoic acid export membrane protein